MCVITDAVSSLQPALSNRYPQLQGLSASTIAEMAKKKQLPQELQIILANQAMGSLVNSF